MQTQNPTTFTDAWNLYLADLQSVQENPLTDQFIKKLKVVFFMGAQSSATLFYEAGELPDEDSSLKRVESLFTELQGIVQSLKTTPDAVMGDQPSQQQTH